MAVMMEGHKGHRTTKRKSSHWRSVMVLAAGAALLVFFTQNGVRLGQSATTSSEEEEGFKPTWQEPKEAVTLPLPTAACAANVAWGSMTRDPKLGLAAVYTPYNIVFGGGERYLLSIVAAMQEFGYSVDVMVEHANLCKSKTQLLTVASGLRVHLNANRVNLVKVVNDRSTLRVRGESWPMPHAVRYSVFMALGNGKIPHVKGIGHVNFYMCQFPFDLARTAHPMDWATISSYDYVLLNSEFTQRWYSHFIGKYWKATIRHYGLIPQIVVLHPPVEPFQAQSPTARDLLSDRRHIVLLGRFFGGRQSKGHSTAIRIFKQILPQLPPGTQLHLVGNLMPEQEEYMANITRDASGLPVVFHVASPSSEVEATLQSALVQWHLTGVESNTTADPASEEHFGISIAEGMTAGVIPVVLNRGGVGDIVKHGYNGFLASHANAIAQYTVHVFKLPTNVTAQLQHHALESTKQFYQTAFTRKFHVLVQRGMLTKPFRHLVNTTRDTVLSRSFKLPTKAENAAVLIEPRQHYALEYVVKNVMYHLTRGGQPWSLYVFHGLGNKAFTHGVLHTVQGTNFREIDLHTVSIPQLNQLLQNVSFWEAIDAKRALLFQTDSLLLRDNIHEFFAFDYIGAPWHTTNERWQHLRGELPEGVGNGGLSLRNVQAMRTMAASLVALNGSMQEDLLFAQKLQHMPGAALAPRRQAYRFCVEVPCVDIEGNTTAAKLPCTNPLRTLPEVPTALHASWYYFSAPADRYADLLRMLEISVCGDGCGSEATSKVATARRLAVSS